MDMVDEEERQARAMRNERGPASGKPTEPEVATVDTLIMRVDLGAGCSTLVAAGDPIPRDLAGLPRKPRES